MITIPDKFEDLDYQQKEYFARIGFDAYCQIRDRVSKSKEMKNLCSTVHKNTSSVFRAMSSLSQENVNLLNDLIIKV